MSEYINLEDKIISLIETLSEDKETLENAEISNQITELTSVFNKYWSEYQDTWSDEYWEVYNIFRQIDNKHTTLIKNKQLNLNNTENTENDLSFINYEEEKMQDCKNGEKVFLSPTKKNKTKTSSVDRSTFNTSINLNKIDEELDKVEDDLLDANENINLIEKRRGCLECLIF